ncbi:MAG: glycosyltransferase family 4 protein [Anaerolineae bacterium]|nr:glycosyltransferase family 4 protein [Anaerolineae bacterium]
MDSLRILHIIQRYWPIRGGAEIHLGEISARLVADGHEVTVLTTDAQDFELFWDPQARRILKHEGWHDGVRILRFPVRHLPFPLLAYPALRRLLWLLSAFHPIPNSWLFSLSRYTPWVPDLSRWLSETKEGFDLVAGMTICFEPLLEAGLHFARRRDIPFVVYPLTHLGAGANPAEDSLSRFYTMRHQVELVKKSDALLAQTPSEQKFYESQGMSGAKIHVAGPGVHPPDVLGGNGARFRIQHQLDAPIVSCISSMSYDKGTVHLVEAARRLWDAGDTLHLILAGAILGPFRHYLESLPAGERDRIMLLGPITEGVKRDLLAASDIVAMPSRTDSFGILYLEAWLYGKPVIAAQTWGVNDLIEHGRDGFLVPFGDVAALAAAIKQLLKYPAERAALGSQGKQKVYRLHTWERKYKIVREIYEHLVNSEAP